MHKKTVNIAIRTDAALHIGIGHVMRCLTLANHLKEYSIQTLFICRAHAGHLRDSIVAAGHECLLLPAPSLAINARPDSTSIPPHRQWLGETWQDDVQQTQHVIAGRHFDWLIVDHYALDERWERAMRSTADKIMVIDDLADRKHDCDLLFDQTLGRTEDIYKPWVPASCTILTGAVYALLRPEFAQQREYSLARRQQPRFDHLLVNFGGIDNDNITGKVLDVLAQCRLPATLKITVVMGASAPCLVQVREQAKQMPVETDIQVNVSNMAEIMANSDLAIGAAGSTSWERCCLGLPTLMLVLADNQQHIADALEKSGAVLLVRQMSDIVDFMALLSQSCNSLAKMSTAARNLVDGKGLDAIAGRMTSTMTGRPGSGV